MQDEVKLYRKNKFGGLSTWKVVKSGDCVMRLFSINSDGQETMYSERIKTNQSGRSVSEQADLVFKSYISRMKDKGYKESREEAMLGATNQLGLIRPMLAQPMKNVPKINYKGAVLQTKLDGHRCLITKQDGELIAYSRQGKIIDTVGHILEELQDLPEGETIDGELYAHGHHLQTISSWIKRLQPDSQKLHFVAYDVIRPETFKDRFVILEEYLFRNKRVYRFVGALGHREYVSPEDTVEMFNRVRNLRYEGLILRTNDRGYEAGVRSQSLIKIKKFFDMECRVLEIFPSKNNWAVCRCAVPDTGKVVDVSAPGTIEEKTEVLMNWKMYVGRMLTISYSELTKDGIPFHPVALRWREDV